MDSSLMLLIDGRFPAGGHAYSAGVEAAVSIGDVVDVASLERYLHGRLATSGRVDAAFAAHTCAHARRAGRDRRPPRRGVLRPRDVAVPPHDQSPPRPSVRPCGRPHLAERRPSMRCRRRPVDRTSRSPSARWSRPREEHRPTPPRSPSTISARRSRRPRFASSVSIRSSSRPCRPGRAAWSIAGRDEWAAWSTASPSDLPAAGGSLTEILGERHGGLDARLFVA